jgi:uncharacterized protein (TIGR00369 family)
MGFGFSMSTDHFRRLERMYLAAPINEFFRPKLSISEGEAEVVIEVGPRMHHTAGAAHGSVYFKLMDDAAFFAVNSLVEDVFVLTVSFNVYLLRPVVDSVLTSRGVVTSATRNLWIADAEVKDDRGKVVGRGSGSFVRSTIVLAEIDAYAADH